MGCKDGRDLNCDISSFPAHEVVIDAFYISEYETTVGQFKRFVDSTNYITDAEKKGFSIVFISGKWQRKEGINWRYNDLAETASDDMPVSHVSWNDANEYCKWMSLSTESDYRLPTEAEWEYAARGGNKSKNTKISSEASIDTIGWFMNNSNGSANIGGLKKPNELGVYDMLGNMGEWVNDWYKEDYYKDSVSKNPLGPSNGIQKIYRGGNWSQQKENIRFSERFATRPNFCGMGIGFRIVKLIL
jgi:formylglycine-generating enzyme required for sulfatase activity